MKGEKKEIKSIFDAINKKDINYEKDETVDESGYKYVNNKGVLNKEEDKRDDKMDQKKRDILKKVRKKADNRKEIRVDSEEKEEEDEEERKYKENRKEDIANNIRVGGIVLSDSDISRLGNIVKALGAPDNIIEKFETEEYKEVLDYLEEEHSIRFESELEKVNEEEKNQKKDIDSEKDKGDSGRDILEIKDGVTLAVMEDGYVTSYQEKWDKSLVIYEGSEDGIELEYLDELSNNLMEFELRVEKENVRRKVYIDKEEVKEVLR